jgi:hypothetical protein
VNNIQQKLDRDTVSSPNSINNILVPQEPRQNACLILNIRCADVSDSNLASICLHHEASEVIEFAV